MKRRFSGGRLGKKLAKKALGFLVSEDIRWDYMLVEDDAVGSEAHIIMLWDSGVLSKEELQCILAALEKVRALNREGRFELKPEFEDVHLNIEDFVVSEVGMDVGGKLHTGRSRNDQIALDIRLYLRREINEIARLFVKLIHTFLNMAKKYVDAVMPGYTHLQHAHPITFGHWLSAYAEMFLRDLERFEETYRRVNLSPLGACALAGTRWPVDREKTASLLGFEGVQENSLDAVTSRGEEAAEFLWDAAVLMVHLSRLSEDLMLWSSYEFGMVEIDDAYAMGSSIMPQKKNPDVAELVRGKTSTTISQLLLSLSIMKGLPSGYFKDLQETKPAVFKASENVKQALDNVEGMMATLKVNRRRMHELSGVNYSTATDLADLVAEKTGMPFRAAYQMVGTLVADAVKRGLKVTEITVEDLRKASLKTVGKEVSLSQREINQVLRPVESIRSKRSLGSPNPKEVLRMLRKSKSRVKEKAVALAERSKKLEEVSRKLQSTVDEILRS